MTKDERLVLRVEGMARGLNQLAYDRDPALARLLAAIADELFRIAYQAREG